MFLFSGSLGDEQLPYVRRGFGGDLGQVRQAVEHIIVGAVVMALEHHRVGFRGIRRFTGMDKPMVPVRVHAELPGQYLLRFFQVPDGVLRLLPIQHEGGMVMRVGRLVAFPDCHVFGFKPFPGQMLAEV